MPMTAMKMTKGKNAKSASKKRAAAGAKRSPRKRSTGASTPPEPTDEAIRLRAYFIAENRVRAGLHGDPSNDWIEARRQLLEEAQNG